MNRLAKPAEMTIDNDRLPACAIQDTSACLGYPSYNTMTSVVGWRISGTNLTTLHMRSTG